MAEAIKRVSLTEEERNSTPSEDAQEAGQDGRHLWYRGVFFQATVVGLCAFAAPGLWNAMQSVGAGGAQTPYLVMYASKDVLHSGNILMNLQGWKRGAFHTYDIHLSEWFSRHQSHWFALHTGSRHSRIRSLLSGIVSLSIRVWGYS